MKALVIKGPGQVHHETISDPELRSSKGAIVEVSSCALCGSDLHLYHHANGAEPFCIGHEAVGKVIEAGKEVRNFRVGDRVLIAGSVGCGECAACRTLNVALCENAKITQVYGQGQPGLGGCQAEYVFVPAADNNLWHMKDGISDEVGLLMSDNLATAWYCAGRARVGPGDIVAVIGLGPVGLSAILAAKAMGCEHVLAIDLVESRRQDAERLGAIPVNTSDVAGFVSAFTRGKGCDAVLDAAGGASAAKLSIRIARRGARISVVGISEDTQIQFPIVELLVKNIEYHAGLTSVQAELPRMEAAINSGKLKVDDLNTLITHHLPLSEGAEAYKLFDARTPGIGKIVFDPAS